MYRLGVDGGGWGGGCILQADSARWAQVRGGGIGKRGGGVSMWLGWMGLEARGGEREYCNLPGLPQGRAADMG